MSNKGLVRKSVVLTAAVMIAGNLMVTGTDGAVFGKLVDYPISTVYAAESELFDGSYAYIQNDAGNPEPAIIVDGNNVAVALFQGSMIQLNCNAGYTPNILAGTEVAASVVAPTNNGILIAGNQVGSGVIQVQNTVTGAVTSVTVNVVPASRAVASDGAGAPVVNSNTWSIDYSAGYPIIRAKDNAYEIQVRDMILNTSDTAGGIPKIYIAEDGILTAETYGGQDIHIPLKVNRSDAFVSHYRGSHSEIGGVDKSFDAQVAAMSSESRIVIGAHSKGGPDISCLTLVTGGRDTGLKRTEHPEYNIPFRIIGIAGSHAIACESPSRYEPIALSSK